jgi:hypothetical protein
MLDEVLNESKNNFQAVLPNIKVHAYFAPQTPPTGGAIAGNYCASNFQLAFN